MKRLALVLIGCLLFSLGIVKAQVFIGGSLSFNSTGGNTQSGSTTVDKNTTTSLGFNPMFGYFLSSKFAAGAALGFNVTKTKTPATPGTPEATSTLTTAGLRPFIRYYAVQMNKFSIYGEVYVGLSVGTQKASAGGTSVKGPKTTSLSLGLLPGVSYDISDNLSLEADINVLNLMYSHVSVKDNTANPKTKDVTSTFSFGAGLDGIVNTGSISIGAIYRF